MCQALTVQDVLILSRTIKEVWASRRPASPRFGFALALNAERMNPVLSAFEASRQAALEQYGQRNPDGSFVTGENTGEGIVQLTDADAFESAIRAIADEGVDLDLKRVALEDLPAEIEPDLVARLMPMIALET